MRVLEFTEDALEDAIIKVLLRRGDCSYESTCDLASQIIDELVSHPMTDAEITGFPEDDEDIENEAGSDDPLGR